jgi:hypothetical protein
MKKCCVFLLHRLSHGFYGQQAVLERRNEHTITDIGSNTSSTSTSTSISACSISNAVQTKVAVVLDQADLNTYHP